MPTTITSLIIIAFAILPGIPAYKLYKTINGFDWRTPDWEKVVCIIGFSFFGLILYVILSSLTSLPSPIYLVPSSFSGVNFNVESLAQMSLPLLGHTISSLMISILLIFLIRLFSKITPISGLPSAWDNFINFSVPGHWVTIKLKDGDTYAGIMDFNDTSVSSEDRDLVLREPAKYIDDKRKYESLDYQYFYFPSTLIASIGVVYDPDIDDRVSPVNSDLFPKEKNVQGQ